MNSSVEEIAYLAKNVLGDDPRTYYAAGVHFSESKKMPEYGLDRPNNVVRRRKYGNDNYRDHKKYGRDPMPYNKHGSKSFTLPGPVLECIKHGVNHTHDSNHCYSLGKRGNTNNFLGKSNTPATAASKLCRYCNKAWSYNHTCREYYSSDRYKEREELKNKILSVHIVDTKAVKEDAENDAEKLKTMLDKLAYDCKSVDNNFEILMTKTEGINPFKLITPIYVENVKLLGKVDTGSDISCINKSVFINKLKLSTIMKASGTLEFLGNSVKRLGSTEPLTLSYINNISFKHNFEVVDFNEHMDFDVLLGTDILSKMNIGLTGVAFHWNRDNIYSTLNECSDDQIRNVNFVNGDQVDEPDNTPFGTVNERDAFMTQIELALKTNEEIPITSFCTVPESVVRLPTKEGATAFQRQYPIPHTLKPVLQTQIDEWLKSGTIVKTTVNTSFNSPLLLVPKRNGKGEIVSHRVCMDTRALNRLLPDNNYPVPLIRDIFDSLAGNKVFTTLDLKSAYNRFLVHPDDQHKLTFTFNNQQYSFQGMCFGVKTVTSLFCKVMDILFQDFDCVRTYVDDCIVASKDLETHAKDVAKVIDRLTSVNLILNQDKCHWAQKSVYMLGFVVTEMGTMVDPRKLKTVNDWPIPRSGKDIQRFMGLVNYFREYIPKISQVAAPLDRLRNVADVKSHWTEVHTSSFKTLKDILNSRALLHYPDMSKKFIIATDASQYGIAAVLTQKDELDRTKHIAFWSSSLSPSQRRWSTTKRELYAIVEALKRFRPYVWGTKFEVHTDHKALVYLHTQKVANSMMIGWLEILLDFDFDVIHIQGILNTLPDELSRLYPPDDDKTLEEGENIIGSMYDKARKHSIYNTKYIRRSGGKIDDKKTVNSTTLIESKHKTVDYICPPAEERDRILKEAHTFGHFGAESIVKEVHSQGCHWINIYDEALEIVKSCKQCQRHNIVKKGYHPLTSITAYLPFDHIAIDLAGPLPVTERGNTFLFIIVDICTKYIIARPLQNKQSDTIAKALIQVFGDYGISKTIQSDNGREFRNSLMDSISRNLGIDRRYSTAFHSRGNGAAESGVKIALNTLRKMVEDNGQDWDHHVPIAQLAMNNRITHRTNSSPFSLMFARKLNPFKEYNKEKKEALPSREISAEELLEKVEKMSEIVFPAIQERTRRIVEEYNKKFNTKNNIITDIPENTSVMVKLPSRTSKLAPIYEGPFTVIRRTQGGSYILRDDHTQELLHRNYVPSELKIVSIDESAIEDEYYEVEDIRDHRGNEGNREYLVKWVGYGERSNTWQTADDFSDPTYINKYWNKQQELRRLEQSRIKEKINTSHKTSVKEKNKNNKREKAEENRKYKKRQKK